MTPFGHAATGLCIADIAARCGWRLNTTGLLIGSVLPDVDFFLLVPLIGRVRGHRTMTHAPLFQLAVAWQLRRFGFASVLIGQLAHSLTDSAISAGKPAEVAWLWPLVCGRRPVLRWLAARIGASLRPAFRRQQLVDNALERLK